MTGVVSSDPTGSERPTRFVQEDADRRRIYALVTGGPDPIGYGPLPLDRIYRARYAPGGLTAAVGVHRIVGDCCAGR